MDRRAHRFDRTYIPTFCLMFLVGCGSGVDNPTIAFDSSAITAASGAVEIAPVKTPALCMEVVGASAVNGAEVALNTCNGSDAQSWTHAKGSLQIFGKKCLEVPNGSKVAGTKLQIQDCNSSETAQQWTQQGNTYVSSAGQMCLDIPGGNAVIGNKLQIYTCNKALTQKWQLQKTSPIRLQSSPTKCVNVAGGSTAKGTPVQIDDCNASSAQLWTYANNTLRVLGGECLTVPSGGNPNDTPLQIADCTSANSNQLWRSSEGLLGWYTTNKCLNVPNNKLTNGTQLEVSDCTNSSSQMWLASFTDPPPAAQVVPPVIEPSSAFLPVVSGTCPSLATGNANFLGQSVRLWAATASSPNSSLILYWHGTGAQPSEALSGLGQTQINDIVAKGGMVAAFTATNGKGQPTVGNHVWYTGDFTTADEVVACAIRDLKIDPRRIYTMGESAGGLHCTWMAYARSGYLAAVAPISGGLLGQNGRWSDPTSTPQDPNNVPFAMVTHGAKGVDVYVPANFDFADASAEYEGDIANKKGMSIDCNTGGGHVSGPPVIGPAIWQFFQDHPFRTLPEPYGKTVPTSFPSYCKIGPIPF